MSINLRAALMAAASALVIGGLLAGCGSTTKLDEVPVENRSAVPVAGGASAPGVGAGAQSSVATVDLSKPNAANAANAALLAQRVVYFDYDSYVVKDEYRTLLEAHAKALAASRAKRMSIEGHTDERGGREYNLALGQKRAEAVLKSMVLLGAADSQLEAVSFGKERAAVQGSDEAAWAKNRRAELKDK